MKELVLMIGIQASGKTTFAKSHFVQTHVYISLDVLKTRFQENLKLKQAISDSKNIVVDNTNVTKKEREKPEIINSSRKQRIAKGSGTQVAEVNLLLKQFEQMTRMMKQFSNPKKLKKLAKMPGLGRFMR